MADKRFRIAGVIQDDNKKIIGYIILDLKTNSINECNIDTIKKGISSGAIANATIDNKGNIKGTEGSLTRLPVYNKNGVIISNSQVVTVLNILDGNKRKVSLMDAYGRLVVIPEEKAISLIESRTATNAKVVTRDNKKFLSAISGTLQVIESQRKSNKDKHWERPLNSARYLGKRYSNSSDFWVMYYNISRLDSELKRLEVNNSSYLYILTQSLYGYRTVFKRVLKQLSQKRISNRTKQHYKKTIEAMEKVGKRESIAKICYEFTNTFANISYMRDLASTDDNGVPYLNVIKYCEKRVVVYYMEILKAFYIDCLIYARLTMVRDSVRLLVDTIQSSNLAKNYFKDASNGVSFKECLTEATKEKFGTKSQILFMSALSIVDYLYRSKQLDVEHAKLARTLSFKVVSSAHVSGLEPLKIENNSGYGAVIYQTLVIALEEYYTISKYGAKMREPR